MKPSFRIRSKAAATISLESRSPKLKIWSAGRAGQQKALDFLKSGSGIAPATPNRRIQAPRVASPQAGLWSFPSLIPQAPADPPALT